MAEEIAFENGQISNFEGLVTLSLTLDWAILHTFVHQSTTSTCMPNFTEIEETFCGRTDGRAHVNGRTFETSFIRSTLSKSRPNNSLVESGRALDRALNPAHEVHHAQLLRVC